MQNQRSRIVWFVAIAVAFFFIVDPFRLFESDNIPRMRVNQDIEREMKVYLESAPDATRYITDSLQTHDLVMIGETGYVKQQLEFLAELIPALDRAGIRHLGFQYANRDDQALIDRLLSGTSFDETLAEQILFEHMVILGYEEYREVFRAAWQVNRSKSANEDPFRIIGISSTPDYTRIQAQSDVDDPEVLRQVFAAGVPDEIMAETILERIVNPGHKGVIYTRMEHAFTSFPQLQYATTMAERGFPGQRRAGNILADRLGDRVMTTIFHTPVQNTRSKTGYGYPIGGLMDKLLEDTPASRRPGFDVADSPYASAPITSDVLGEGLENELTLEQLTDGYLLISRIGDFVTVTPIPDFITERNIERARAEFPGADPGEVSPEEMNEFMEGTLASLTRIFEGFR